MSMRKIILELRDKNNLICSEDLNKLPRTKVEVVLKQYPLERGKNVNSKTVHKSSGNQSTPVEKFFNFSDRGKVN